jgi:anti-anti-sigma factor
MELRIDKDGDIVIVKISGNMGFEDIGVFTHKMIKEIEENFHPKFVFDLEDMPYINSATIGKFAHIFKKINSAHGLVTFCNVRPFVRNILDITKLSTIFDIYPDRKSAVDAIHAKNTGV